MVKAARKQKPVDLARARRARKRGPARFVRPTAAFAILALLVLTMWAGAALRVSRIRVLGLRTLSPGVVMQASGLHGGERILLTRLGAPRRRVRALPGVKHADLSRAFPATIVIRVIERTPLAVLDAQPALAVDGEGRMFAAPQNARLPALSGWDGKARAGGAVDAQTAALLASYASFPEPLRAIAVQVRAGADVALTTASGTQVRFGRAEMLTQKAAAAWAVLQDAAGRGVTLDYVDVRAPRTPVVQERGAATPAPVVKKTAPKASTKPTARPAAGATPRPSPKPTPKPSPKPKA